MSKVEEFLRDFPNVDSNLFSAPTCPDFEDRHKMILGHQFDPVSGDFTDTTVSGRLYRDRVRYLDYWQELPNGAFVILVKNPRDLRGFGLGEKNALIYTGESGYLYAGAILQDMVYARRPVIPKFQEQLREEMKRALAGIKAKDLPGLL